MEKGLKVFLIPGQTKALYPRTGGQKLGPLQNRPTLYKAWDIIHALP